MDYDIGKDRTWRLGSRLATALAAALAGCTGSALEGTVETDGETEGAATETATHTGSESDDVGETGEETGNDDIGETDAETDGETENEESCPPREISDFMTTDWFHNEPEVLDCSVFDVDVQGDDLQEGVEHSVVLRCQAQGAPSPEMRDFVFEVGGVALEGDFPIGDGQVVELHTWVDDIGPFWESFVLRDAADGRLLLAYVGSTGPEPYMAEPSFMAPLSASIVGGVCPSEGESTRRAISVAHDDDGVEVTVLDGFRDVLDTTSAGRFEVRVAASSYHGDVVGGCNSCNRYTVLAIPD